MSTDKKNVKAFFESAWDPLHCPCCGEDRLHQTGMVVFSRPHEDAEEVIRTDVRISDYYFPGPAATVVRTEKNSGENPSARRQSSVLKFQCEQGCEVELGFAQHKGGTYLVWRW